MCLCMSYFPESNYVNKQLASGIFPMSFREFLCFGETLSDMRFLSFGNENVV